MWTKGFAKALHKGYCALACSCPYAFKLYVLLLLSLQLRLRVQTACERFVYYVLANGLGMSAMYSRFVNCLLAYPRAVPKRRHFRC